MLGFIEILYFYVKKKIDLVTTNWPLFSKKDKNICHTIDVGNESFRKVYNIIVIKKIFA